jgi:S1-C subfamily serine protease
VIGYPLGGALTLRGGTVVDRIDGGDFGIPGAVLRLNARVQPDNSGGPVLNRHNRIVAVVFAIEISTGLALAIPVDTMMRLLDVGGLEKVAACGGV